MKTRKSIRFIALLMVCAIAVGAYPAFAEEEPPTIKPMYNEIMTFDTIFDVTSRDRAEVEVFISALSCRIDASVELQRSSGSGWTHVVTWTDSNKDVLSISETHPVNLKYEYRMVVTAKVYNSSGILADSVTKTVY